ncbi:extracellular solute-binding protein [Cellulosimicrobium sp. 72-3]|uniref:extracellular solute-binding protein n=1 Tax=Cellulosimicrobium sp. 72-3 TaxID=2731680 RepID=UPI00148EB97F|nr:extracellular solute-binding protein [Cellulosimicrobium sp. 72-3]
MHITRRDFSRLVAGGIAVASLGGQTLTRRAAAAGTAAEPQVVITGPRHDWLDTVEASLDQITGRTGLSVAVRRIDGPTMQDADWAGTDLALLHVGAEAEDALAAGRVQDVGSLVSTGRLDLRGRTGLEQALATADAGGALPGIPFVSDETVVYHRDDMLTALGGREPESLDDLIAAAYQLTDDSAGVAGVVLVDDAATVLPMVYAFGGFVAEDGMIGLAGIESSRAYGFLRQMVVDCSAGQEPARGLVEAVERFSSGQARLLVAGDGLLPILKTLDPDGVIGSTSLPAGPAGNIGLALPTWVLGVASSSTLPERAVKVLQALADVRYEGSTATQEGIEVTSLASGNPVVDTPDELRDEAPATTARADQMVARIFSREGQEALVAPVFDSAIESGSAAAELARVVG